MASVSNFTSTGKRVSYAPRAGVPKANLGREIDGKIYQHPRLVAEPLQGNSVRVTNPAASGVRGRNSRTAGLGMGVANTNMQRGRNRDF